MTRRAFAEWQLNQQLPTISMRQRVLLVEARDEVFARIAADLKARRVQVERARSAVEASQRVFRSTVDLVIAYRELPDESGWLMASKWCLSKNKKNVWLYTAWPSPVDPLWAELTQVEKLIYYGGDLYHLASDITQLVSGQQR